MMHQGEEVSVIIFTYSLIISIFDKRNNNMTNTERMDQITKQYSLPEDLLLHLYMVYTAIGAAAGQQSPTLADAFTLVNHGLGLPESEETTKCLDAILKY
jgi:hypothetical protein